MRRHVVIMILAALLMSACVRTRYPDAEQVSPQERIVIKFSHVVAENTPKGLAARRFASQMKERTGGRVEVQVFPNSQLYQDGEELVALRTGAVQIIAPSLSKLTDLDPVWQVFDLPYLLDSDAGAERIMSGETGQRLNANLRRGGIEPLGLWHSGFKQLTNNRAPLRGPADVRGLRFRIQPSLVMRDAFQTLGAEVSVRPFDQVYSAIAARELDGQENTAANMYSKRIHELQPYMTLTDHGYLGYVVLINLKFFNDLPPEIREALREAMADATQWVRENNSRINNEALERIRASGKTTVSRQTAEEQRQWRVALEPVYRRTEDRLGSEVMKVLYRDLKGE